MATFSSLPPPPRPITTIWQTPTVQQIQTTHTHSHIHAPTTDTIPQIVHPALIAALSHVNHTMRALWSTQCWERRKKKNNNTSNKTCMSDCDRMTDSEPLLQHSTPPPHYNWWKYPSAASRGKEWKSTHFHPLTWQFPLKAPAVQLSHPQPCTRRYKCHSTWWWGPHIRTLFQVPL